MPGWNFADAFEVIADCLPDATAQINGRRQFTWAEFDRRADGVATVLLASGLDRQGKVAQYLYNGPEYLESMLAAFKISLVPVNTNYRYRDDELVYLWTNAEVSAVVFDGSFTAQVEGIRARLRGVRVWLWVDDGSCDCPGWAIPYEEAAASAVRRPQPRWSRDGDDLNLLYTGGTTGAPRGVMWRQDDLFCSLNGTSARRYGPEPDVERIRELSTGPGIVALPAAPLMHGTGCFTSLGALSAGGSVVTLEARSFDPVEFLDTVERERVNAVAWVGDAFAKPVLMLLDGQPDRWDISSLTTITSSGVTWSESTKRGLLRHHPHMRLVDVYSSSEALGLGASLSTGDGSTGTSRFTLGERARVIDEDGNDIAPGSGAIGRMAVRGRIPLGYYNDPQKTAATIVVIDGDRYSIPGDFARVEDDGTVTLLGRGSMCINTGGEKVFPEEVEEVLKQHVDIVDAAVIGVPHERFGEAVVAIVELSEGCSLYEPDVIAHVKNHLAAYKAPKQVIRIDSIGRGPNGKIDYARLREQAINFVEVTR
jgi:acyl-CoA synthetase (AMP-forming)/AMP-acid ligase II